MSLGHILQYYIYDPSMYINKYMHMYLYVSSNGYHRLHLLVHMFFVVILAGILVILAGILVILAGHHLHLFVHMFFPSDDLVGQVLP